jgi:uncharacterized MAPEG superfamily protein
MVSRNSATQTSTRPQEDRSRGELANVLALVALPAIGIAYLAMFTVLGDTNYASKFENGELPAGFDGTGGQSAAVTSIGAALFALAVLVAALAGRPTKTVGVVAVLALMAAVPYVPLELVTWQLAF